MGASGLIGGRYRPLNLLGTGGMGQVHRALDLLTGSVVAVKSVKAALEYLDVPTRLERFPGGGSDKAQTASAPDDTVRAALAHEFELLSNLRHENIISVLDYGFEPRGQPYYAMTLAEGANTITQAGKGASFDVQVDLLAQLLRGLEYLHWAGILHRDLKPSNVLVVDGKVKLLDFGIAVATAHLDGERPGEFGGTLAYVAPEVLRGRPASAAADLFGVGMIAFQMLTGHNPRSLDSRQQLVRDILTKVVDGNVAGVPPELEPVLTRLLDASPEDRYQDARSALVDLSKAVTTPLQVETAASRESFLASAPLAGREAELSMLRDMAKALTEGQGGAVLVGGPSGIGKSRLLEEARITAQVRGALVLRGQALSDAGGPFQLWIAVARSLLLASNPTDLEAGVLLPLVPDVAELLGRPIEAAPALPPAQVLTRTSAVLRSMLANTGRPVFLMLEDLQWASDESLRILEDLVSKLGARGVLVLASFRSDEAPELPSRFERALRLDVGPLDREAVDHFVRRVTGASPPPGHIDALYERSGGNPFFLVEMLRQMAGEVGDLHRVGQASLPDDRLALQRIAQEKLRSVPPSARGLLELAAVAGRDLDLRLLETLEPKENLERWVGLCTRASVFEVRSGAVRFTHDKVREGILAHLGEQRRTSIHRRIAETLEAQSDSEVKNLPALLHHWSVAGEADKERDYAARAGRWALETGACSEAVVFLSRALELHADNDQSFTDTGAGQTATGREDLQALLTEANFQLGRLDEVRHHGELALALLGQPVPRSGLGWALGTMGHLATRLMQAYFPRSIRRICPAERRSAEERLRVLERMMELFIYAEQPLQILWAGLRFLNLGERLGDSPQLARGYSLMGVVVGSVPMHEVAESWGARAKQLAEALDPEGPTRIYVAVRRGVYGIGTAQWTRTETEIRDALEVAHRLEDSRGADECRIVLAKVLHYASRFEQSDRVAQELLTSARQRDDRQAIGWGLLARTESSVRLGAHDAVEASFEELDNWVENAAASTEKICPVGMMGLAHARAGRVDEAMRCVDRVLELTRTTNVLVYWTLSGLVAASEVLHGVLTRSGGQGSSVEGLAHLVKTLGKFARVFPMGRPAHLRARGQLEWHHRRPAKAFAAWQASAEEAAKLGMAFEEGVASLELAWNLDATDSRRSRLARTAREKLEAAGASYELAQLDKLT